VPTFQSFQGLHWDGFSALFISHLEYVLWVCAFLSADAATTHAVQSSVLQWPVRLRIALYFVLVPMAACSFNQLQCAMHVSPCNKV